MGEALIEKRGGELDISDLTAVPGDVVSGYTFIGSGSSNTQSGAIPEKGSPQYNLPINGEIVLPAGVYEGGNVTQNIPTLGEQSYNIGKNPIIVPTAEKYMTGNIKLMPITNLTPDVIKKGEYVGGVGPGTWEGYVNDNPLSPYYNGTFYQGQSAEILTGNPNETLDSRKGPYRGYLGTISFQRQTIRSNHPRDNQISTSGIVFNMPYNLSNLAGLAMDIQTVTSNESGGEVRMVLAQNKVTDWVRNYATSYNPALGQVYADIGIYDEDVSSSTEVYDFVFSSGATEAYLYVIYVSRYAQTRDTYYIEFYN